MTFYNQLHEVEEKKACKHFELDVTIEESSGIIPFTPKFKHEHKDNIHTDFQNIVFII